MSSLKDRQRAAARARLEREMAARAAAAQRRRQIRSAIGAGLGVLVVLGAIVWIVVATTGGGSKKPAAAAGASASASAAATPGACAWNPVDTAATPNPNLKNVGMPPTSGEPRSGTETMTIKTNLGTIDVSLDVAHAPCTSASFAYLASKKFFDNTSCHRLTTSGIYVLQCGDPSATGMGGPTYQFKNENLPTGKSPAYPAGTVAMANTGTDGTNGSQFFIVYKDTDLPAQYTVLGKITSGLNIVQKVAAAGTAAPPKGASPTPGDGKPKLAVKIETLTVSGASAAVAPSPSAATSPTGSPSASAKS